MLYRKDRYGNELSALGFGCMRFTTANGKIDLEKAEKEILRSIELGVNYFDTAYIYTGSEAAIGEIFERNGVRDRIKIATKLPQYLISNRKAIDRYFNEQLSRLRTDHVDYYLMHMLTDIEAWNKLVTLGIKDWIEEKKKNKEIGQIGFSFHGNTEMFLKILNAYDWDFCQIQYNYLDETSQAGRKGLEEAEKKGIPVIIMEPLRGGKLVDLLPGDAKKMISENNRGYSPAEWAFRWLWDQSGVTVVLSGMNSLEMLEENCRVAGSCEAGSFSDEDRELIEKVRDSIRDKMKIGCTGCRYCMPCPKGVDIPGIFRCYNHMYTESKGSGRKEYFQTVGFRKNPSDASLCIQCGKCESHCPQHLEIRKLLKTADRELRPWYIKIMTAVARRFAL
ncbi:MAG: aldo/keto reductase [Lachnospiraceae bacterium]|nr:aldo/keto reductase [Lachnospiraceae bacterium]